MNRKWNHSTDFQGRRQFLSLSLRWANRVILYVGISSFTFPLKLRASGREQADRRTISEKKVERAALELIKEWARLNKGSETELSKKDVDKQKEMIEKSTKGILKSKGIDTVPPKAPRNLRIF